MSERQVRQLYAETEQLTKTLRLSGWSEAGRTDVSDTAGPSDLFTGDSIDRPLVVGLFGGTGVGKSSLLNRLAGHDIARTGVVRPTSMEITAYLHNNRQIASLPQGFPADRFSEVHHSNEKFIDVMWVDMPDFDSEETQNRDQVKGWLPHLDLLLYVVTPERYKDEEGWRLLIQHGYRHAWLFVMNQWDKAEDSQLDDFRLLLSRAGFKSPHLFRTICSVPAVDSARDDFKELAETVARLARRNIVKQLEQRGWLQRLAGAAQRLGVVIDTLQNAEKEKTLVHSFDQHWQEFCASAKSNLDLPFKQYSEQFSGASTAAPGAALKSLITSASGSIDVDQHLAAGVAMKTDVTALWDDWSATRLQDAVSQFELAHHEHGVPQSLLKKLGTDVIADTTSTVKSQLQSELDRAIKNPGTAFQRNALPVIRHMQWLLPLAALLWVAYRIVSGFVVGVADSSSYVGLDFFINGVLLVGISWFIPWLLMKILKPSMPMSVYNGLRAGLGNGLTVNAEVYRTGLLALSSERASLVIEANKLHDSIASVLENSTDEVELDGMVLSVTHDVGAK